jgi:hypothetical protein
LSPQFIRAKRAYAVDMSEELERFLNSCRDQWLRGKIQAALSELKADYLIGTKVKKDQWPSSYIRKWGIRNLYVYKLGPDWRLTYSLVGDGGGISVFCLEVLPHGEYDRRFGYRTS